MDKKSTNHFMKWTTECVKFLLSFTVNFIFLFLLKHSTGIHQWLYFYLKSTGCVHFIIIPLTFSLIILVKYLLLFVFTSIKKLLRIGDNI